MVLGHFTNIISNKDFRPRNPSFSLVKKEIFHQYDLIGLSPIVPLAHLNHDRWLAPEQGPIVVLEPWLWKGYGSVLSLA